MMVAMDSIYASPSLAVFVSNFSMENKLHLALAKVNVFTIWTLVVVSIGLAKIFQRDYPKVLTLILAIWVLWFALAIMLGINLGM
jgi:hypothetical protein